MGIFDFLNNKKKEKAREKEKLSRWYVQTCEKEVSGSTGEKNDCGTRIFAKNGSGRGKNLLWTRFT